ncbi:MAG: DUF4314 domain-containing protein [Clostridia bacterium]|nr:DUF4314 domain-containing protein [Clostridia bacterium]
MKFPSSETAEAMRKKYPVGTRVKLIRMNDCQAPPIGSFGTVLGVDDIASLMVQWDAGGSLNVAYGEDIVQKVEVTTVCYGEKEEWTSRREAQKSFLEAMNGCDPNSSECGRYAKIYAEIVSGQAICTDEE